MKCEGFSKTEKYICIKARSHNKVGWSGATLIRIYLRGITVEAKYDDVEVFIVTPTLMTILIAYTAALARPWSGGWSKSAEEACLEAGLLPSWGKVESSFHLTRQKRRVDFGEEGRRAPSVEKVLCDEEGNLWVLAHRGRRHDAPGFYARCGKIEGAGPLIPIGLVNDFVKAVAGPCDCGYSNCTHEEVWGSGEEQQEARNQLVKRLLEISS